MLRTTAGALAAAAFLVGGLPSAPAGADRTYQPWGKTWAQNQPFKRGCHHYRWDYKITAPNENWAAEVILKNPHGHQIANAALDTASEPDRGHKYWYLCYQSTVSGRYTMTMKVTYQPTDETSRDGYVRPSHFRLYRTAGR